MVIRIETDEHIDPVRIFQIKLRGNGGQIFRDHVIHVP